MCATPDLQNPTSAEGSAADKGPLGTLAAKRRQFDTAERELTIAIRQASDAGFTLDEIARSSGLLTVKVEALLQGSVTEYPRPLG